MGLLDRPPKVPPRTRLILTWCKANRPYAKLRPTSRLVYNGDNTGQNHNGIRNVARLFAAGGFATALDLPTEFDVLAVAKNQIALAEQDAPTHILMNPTDVTKMLLVKESATNRQYVLQSQEVAQRMSFMGIPIIATTLVTAGQYLIGHFPNASVYVKDGLRIEFGYDSDDFTKNNRTVRAEWRAATVVRTNRRSSFVKGVFATDITAITKP